jgi:peroxidase
MNQGCDASILLNGPGTEKTAVQNTGMFAYDFIDDVKSQLEAACPGVVSCADIIVAATRDAVGMVHRYSLSFYPHDSVSSHLSEEKIAREGVLLISLSRYCY